MVAYAVAYKIAYTAGYIKLHMIFSEFLRKWETTFWGNERQQKQQKPLPKSLRFAVASLKMEKNIRLATNRWLAGGAGIAALNQWKKYYTKVKFKLL